MLSLNKVLITGHAGKDIEVSPHNGGLCANLSVATTNSYQKNGEWVKETDWHNIVAFGKTVEWAQKIKKGDTVYVEGRLKTFFWIDQQGVDRKGTQIIAEKLYALCTKKNDAANSVPNSIPSELVDEDVPF